MKRISFRLTIRKDCVCEEPHISIDYLAQIINAANPARRFPCGGRGSSILTPDCRSTTLSHQATPYKNAKRHTCDLHTSLLGYECRVVHHGSRSVSIIEEGRILIRFLYFRQVPISISWRREEERERERISERRDRSIINILCTWIFK